MNENDDTDKNIRSKKKYHRKINIVFISLINVKSTRQTVLFRKSHNIDINNKADKLTPILCDTRYICAKF